MRRRTVNISCKYSSCKSQLMFPVLSHHLNIPFKKLCLLIHFLETPYIVLTGHRAPQGYSLHGMKFHLSHRLIKAPLVICRPIIWCRYLYPFVQPCSHSAKLRGTVSWTAPPHRRAAQLMKTHRKGIQLLQKRPE